MHYRSQYSGSKICFSKRHVFHIFPYFQIRVISLDRFQEVCPIKASVNVNISEKFVVINLYLYLISCAVGA